MTMTKTKIKNIYDGFCDCPYTEGPCGHKIQFVVYLEDEDTKTDFKDDKWIDLIEIDFAYSYKDIIYNKNIISLHFLWVGFKVFHKLFDYFFEMPKLDQIIIPSPCEFFVPSKIALLQNLTYLLINSVVSSGYISKIYKKYISKYGEDNYKGYYIYKDKMLIWYITEKSIIPSHIKYLSIVNDNLIEDKKYLWNNLPINIEHLSLTVDNIEVIKNINLPVCLKTFNLRLRLSKNNKINEKLIDNIKIPFGCTVNFRYHTVI